MKVLILSCDTGQGHNSAARAVFEAFDRRGNVCEMFDPLTLGRKKSAHIVSATYSGMLRKAPAVFGVLYRAGDIYSSTGITSPIYRANTHYADSLREYITSNSFDAVVSTHLFSMEALTAIRRKPDFHVPCFGVLTDYTRIPFFAETDLDGYFIPHDDLMDEMTVKGMPEERIFATGIPVSARFANHTDKDEAREILGIPHDIPAILVMSGGVGCGHIVNLCREFLKKNDTDFVLRVLTGKNTAMKKEIDETFGGDGRIQTVPFTERVNLYMNASDVMISKPGGLTSTEAAVANIPLVHLLAYTGCETKNIEFFSERGISLRAGNIKDAVHCAWNLIDDKSLADSIREMQRKYIAPDAADRIVSKVISYV